MKFFKETKGSIRLFFYFLGIINIFQPAGGLLIGLILIYTGFKIDYLMKKAYVFVSFLVFLAIANSCYVLMESFGWLYLLDFLVELYVFVSIRRIHQIEYVNIKK